MKIIYFLLSITAGSLGMAVYNNGEQSGGIWLMCCGGALLARTFD